MDQQSGISEACDTMGGQIELAKHLGVSQQRVSQWIARGFAPLDRVPQIAELTGVDRKRLCDPHIVEVLDPE